MDVNTLLAGLDFTRSRLWGILDPIEKERTGFREGPATGGPAPGRAHIAWQAMHCAATHDRYLNVGLKGGKVTDEALVAAYAGGSTPSDDNIPDLSAIRSALEVNYRPFRDHVAGLTQADFDRMMPSGRTIGQSILLMSWHEAHHQGQIHLTWNMYKEKFGVK